MPGPIVIGANSVTPITATSDLEALLPNPNRGQPAPVITSVTLPGAHGAVPALVQGPSYDVVPIKLANGQYTFAGAKPHP